MRKYKLYMTCKSQQISNHGGVYKFLRGLHKWHVVGKFKTMKDCRRVMTIVIYSDDEYFELKEYLQHCPTIMECELYE